MTSITCVFEHVINYLTDDELTNVLSIEEFSKHRKLYNKSTVINQVTCSQEGHTLELVSTVNKTIENKDIVYFPEIFTLKLSRTIIDLTPFKYLQELNLYFLNCVNTINFTELNLKNLTVYECEFNATIILNNKFNTLTDLKIVKTITNFYDFINNFKPNNFPKLKSVSFINTNINSKRKLRILSEKLNEMNNLTNLDLSNNDFSNDVEIEFFSNYDHINNLHTLKLSNCNLTCTTILLLHALINNNNSLKILHLNDNEQLFCCDDKFFNFIEVITLLQLEELDISNTEITESIIFIICKVLSQHLKKLKINNCHIKDFYKKKLEENFKDYHFSKKNCSLCRRYCYNVNLNLI